VIWLFYNVLACVKINSVVRDLPPFEIAVSLQHNNCHCMPLEIARKIPVSVYQLLSGKHIWNTEPARDDNILAGKDTCTVEPSQN
jgi:hypothetical protein